MTQEKFTKRLFVYQSLINQPLNEISFYSKIKENNIFLDDKDKEEYLSSFKNITFRDVLKIESKKIKDCANIYLDAKLVDDTDKEYLLIHNEFSIFIYLKLFNDCFEQIKNYIQFLKKYSLNHPNIVLIEGDKIKIRKEYLKLENPNYIIANTLLDAGRFFKEEDDVFSVLSLEAINNFNNYQFNFEVVKLN
ncbi:hypothetical protein [Aureivirga marina]|uniref:hypothetical protein n=1 Tax=Aureivirga marina TaxID=1182451 RepID=UPI0018CA13D6|nr:hypothetical protein [Aureivirga marina]